MVPRLLDQQLQAWRISVELDQSILEKRCARMEGNLAAMRRETRWLEGILTQVTFHYLHLFPFFTHRLGGTIGVGAQHAFHFQALNKVPEEHTEEKEEEEEKRQQEEDDKIENEDEEVIEGRYCEKEMEPEAPQQKKASPHRVMDVIITHEKKGEEAEEKDEIRQEEQEVERECMRVSVEQRLQEVVVGLRMRMEIVDSCSGESSLLLLLLSSQQIKSLTCIIPDSRHKYEGRACGGIRPGQGLHTPPGEYCKSYNLRLSTP